MSPAWFDDVRVILTLALRWLWLSGLVLGIFWLIRRVAALEGRLAAWPWWLPLLLGALLASASWVVGRCG